jgi:hypothetical protein
MNIEQFGELSLQQKAGLLQRRGVILPVCRYTSRFCIRLYALAGFYVEGYFEKGNSLPFAFFPFEDLHFIDPYLREIDISPLQTLLTK